MLADNRCELLPRGVALPWPVLSRRTLGSDWSTGETHPRAARTSFLSLTLPTLLPSRFVGRPGSYVYVFDGYRMEEASIAAGFSCLAGGS